MIDGDMDLGVIASNRETEEDTDAAILHAAVECAYAQGLSPKEVCAYVHSDPELRRISEAGRGCVYLAETGSDCFDDSCLSRTTGQ